MQVATTNHTQLLLLHRSTATPIIYHFSFLYKSFFLACGCVVTLWNEISVRVWVKCLHTHFYYLGGPRLAGAASSTPPQKAKGC